MLFNVIAAVLVAYVCISPYFYAKAVKFGMKLVEKPEKVVDEPIFNVPKPKKKPKMTPEQERMSKIYENMMRYDGTSNGQKEIRANG